MISALCTTVEPSHDEHFISHENVELSGGQFSDLQCREKYPDTSLWFLRITSSTPYAGCSQFWKCFDWSDLPSYITPKPHYQFASRAWWRVRETWWGPLQSRPRLILIFTDLNSWSWKKCLITQSGLPQPSLEILKIKVCGNASPSMKMLHAECEVRTKVIGNI